MPTATPSFLQYVNPSRKITKIPLLRNPLFRHLDLGNNLIKELQNLDALRNLVSAQLSFNRLIRFDYLCKFTTLQYLNLSYNQIQFIPKQLHLLKHLFELSLTGNRITLETQLNNLRLQKLQRLSFSKNPVCEILDFKFKLQANCPQLKYLDGLIIDSSVTKTAQFGPPCTISRDQQQNPQVRLQSSSTKSPKERLDSVLNLATQTQAFIKRVQRISYQIYFFQICHVTSKKSALTDLNYSLTLLFQRLRVSIDQSLKLSEDQDKLQAILFSLKRQSAIVQQSKLDFWKLLDDSVDHKACMHESHRFLMAKEIIAEMIKILSSQIRILGGCQSDLDTLRGVVYSDLKQQSPPEMLIRENQQTAMKENNPHETHAAIQSRQLEIANLLRRPQVSDNYFKIMALQAMTIQGMVQGMAISPEVSRKKSSKFISREELLVSFSQQDKLKAKKPTYFNSKEIKNSCFKTNLTKQQSTRLRPRSSSNSKEKQTNKEVLVRPFRTNSCYVQKEAIETDRFKLLMRHQLRTNMEQTIKQRLKAQPKFLCGKEREAILAMGPHYLR